MFGTIWTALQTEVIRSPQEWKAKALAAFEVAAGRKIFTDDDSFF
jgi:asparagine synthetase A